MNFLIPPWAKYLIALLLFAAVYGKGYSDGKDAERATWQAARAELLRLRSERVNAAAQHLAESVAAVPQAATKEIVRVETRWIDRPVRECFDDDLVRSLEEARAAVRRSAAPGASND